MAPPSASILKSTTNQIRDEEEYKSRPLHIISPLSHSISLSKHLGVPVYLKLDAVQPASSFKIRGLGLCCWRAVNQRNAQHLICSSAGNAGYAVAYSARMLQVKATIVVPVNTNPALVERLQELEGANVVLHGRHWSEADVVARQLVAEDPTSAYIPPFDHPDIWEGNSTVVTELPKQFEAMGINKPPGLIVCVVGGGGLLCGITEGLRRNGWDKVPILAVETEGAASYQSALLGKGPLTKINTIARTLATSYVCEKAVQEAQNFQIKSCLVSDAEAAKATINFMNQNRLLVEASCGAGLAALYEKKPELMQFQPESIVVIVCGGNGITFDDILTWQTQFNL